MLPRQSKSSSRTSSVAARRTHLLDGNLYKLDEDAAGLLVFIGDEGVLSVVRTPRRMLCPVLTPGCTYVRVASDGGPSFLVLGGHTVVKLVKFCSF